MRAQPKSHMTDAWEIRRASTDTGLEVAGRMLRGVPIVFDSLSRDLGGFRERIRPEAVERTLREGADVRALIDHNPTLVLGRTTAGTLTLRKERDGLAARIDPPETTFARDLLVSVERGDISGMSFGFRALTDEWRMEGGVPVREITDMLIRDVSIVTFPAYDATDVNVALRSLDAYRRCDPMARRRRVFLGKGR